MEELREAYTLAHVVGEADELREAMDSIIENLNTVFETIEEAADDVKRRPARAIRALISYFCGEDGAYAARMIELAFDDVRRALLKRTNYLYSEPLEDAAIQAMRAFLGEDMPYV